MFVYNKDIAIYLVKWNFYFLIQYQVQYILNYVKDYQIMNNFIEIK